jgi:solute carrier family 44 (choline transporter-like protein), member 2/4/5
VKNDDKMSGKFCESFCLPVSKHIGSVSLGSFFVAVVEFIRDRINSKSSYFNPLGCFLKIIMCCLASIIKAITKFAYTMMALTGESFCTSAKDGFNLVIENFGTYVAV